MLHLPTGGIIAEHATAQLFRPSFSCLVNCQNFPLSNATFFHSIDAFV